MLAKLLKGLGSGDPLTHKFSTEYDLIFDEESPARRQQMLDTYDRRRALAEKDRYGDIPLVGPDIDCETVDTAVRNVYLPPASDEIEDSKHCSACNTSAAELQQHIRFYRSIARTGYRRSGFATPAFR
jgi:hypothetical protein